MNYENIPMYLIKGHKEQHWYEDNKKVLVRLFGIERLTLVTKLFAATSINTSLASNITLFRKALYEIENGLPIGNYLPNIQQQLQRIREGKDLSGQKINAFAKAMQGDHNAVVVDIWLCRAFGLQVHSPSPGQFKRIEAYVRDISPKYDLKPYEAGAMIWAGCRRHYTGRKSVTRYESLLQFHFNNLFNCI